jgi:type II secretory pathway pseudopilin PulG
VESLVVIAIIAILAILLLSAIGKVRQTAARTVVSNDLRQCAIAVHNYHGKNNRLPNAAGPDGIDKNAAIRSLWFHLLSFVEAEPVYKNDVHDATVPAFLTPSDRLVTDTAGKIDFAANIRVFGYQSLGKDADNAVDPASGAASGLTLAGRLKARMACGLTLARIPNGTSNVIMLATRYADCGSPVQSTRYSASPIGTMLTSGGPGAAAVAPMTDAKGDSSVPVRTSSRPTAQA